MLRVFSIRWRDGARALSEVRVFGRELDCFRDFVGRRIAYMESWSKSIARRVAKLDRQQDLHKAGWDQHSRELVDLHEQVAEMTRRVNHLTDCLIDQTRENRQLKERVNAMAGFSVTSITPSQN